jgi:hypothetical protein
MAIDDPINAAESLVSSDERQQSPITALLARALSALPMSIIPQADAALSTLPTLAAVVASHLESRKIANWEFLLTVVKAELHRLGERVDQLADAHRRFLTTDFVDLLEDGFRKAANIRARDRIERLGHILGTAAKLGPSAPPDETEEMMRIILDLEDNDVRVLWHLAEVSPPSGFTREQLPDPEKLLRAITTGGDILDERALSACLKLQSYGLIVQGSESSAALSRPRFRMLRKGIRLIQFLGLATEEQIRNLPRAEH